MNKNNKELWYAAKCLFVHKMSRNKGNAPKYTYEERIILIKADNFDQAIEKAEKEASEYEKLNECKYTGYIDVFHLFENKIDDLSEIFSTMQLSDLSAKKYIDQFYPEDMDNCEKYGYEHKWHKSDDENSKCYNCAIVKKWATLVKK